MVNNRYTVLERSFNTKYRFLYFLRDMGVKSAHDAAVVYWTKYITTLQHIIDGSDHVGE